MKKTFEAILASAIRIREEIHESAASNIRKAQIKSNKSSNLFFHMILQNLVYTNKNKMAKYLQWKMMCGETTCRETLYKPRPHNPKIKNKLN